KHGPLTDRPEFGEAPDGRGPLYGRAEFGQEERPIISRKYFAPVAERPKFCGMRRRLSRPAGREHSIPAGKVFQDANVLKRGMTCRDFAGQITLIESNLEIDGAAAQQATRRFVENPPVHCQPVQAAVERL